VRNGAPQAWLRCFDAIDAVLIVRSSQRESVVGPGGRRIPNAEPVWIMCKSEGVAKNDEGKLGNAGEDTSALV
jgi:hypothetical protein